MRWRGDREEMKMNTCMNMKMEMEMEKTTRY
jgi:hypothetical protein